MKSEASLNCVNGHWSLFNCFMGLSSVLGLPIHSFSPENGRKNVIELCNAQLLPGENLQNGNPVRTLWMTSGERKSYICFSSLPNHIVPMIVVKIQKIEQRSRNIIKSKANPSTDLRIPTIECAIKKTTE